MKGSQHQSQQQMHALHINDQFRSSLINHRVKLADIVLAGWFIQSAATSTVWSGLQHDTTRLTEFYLLTLLRSGRSCNSSINQLKAQTFQLAHPLSAAHPAQNIFVHAPWFFQRPWRYTSHVLTYLLTYLLTLDWKVRVDCRVRQLHDVVGGPKTVV